MGNVQSEPSAGGGSRKEQASERSSDSRRKSSAEPEATPSSPARRLARGLGVWFPGNSAPQGLLGPPEPPASPSPLPLELPSPVTPPSEEAAVAAAAGSTPPPPPVGALLPAPSKWRKTTGTPVPRIRGLLEASHRGQGDPPSPSPLPPPALPRTEEGPDPAPRAPSLTPPPLETRKPPPPPSLDRQSPDRRISPAVATPSSTPTESQVGRSSERPTAGGACGGAPPQAGEGEMARPSASESSLSLLCQVTLKSGPPLPPAAASSSLVSKVSLRGGGGRGLFAASSGAISYAEALKQGPLAPGAPHPPGEVPRGTQETEGGNGDGEGCSGPTSAPVSHARALPPPPYTTFPGSKPKFDWVSPSDGSERHFRFNGAGGGIGAPRRRAAALSGPWGSPLPPPSGQIHPAPGPRRPAPALLAPPMFIFPAPTNGEPVRPGPPGPLEWLPPPPPPTPPPAPPPTPQPSGLQPTPQLAALPPTPGSGHLESAPAPAPPLASAEDLAPVPSPAPTPTKAEPLQPVPAPIKARTRRNKGSRSARVATREDGVLGEGAREPTAAIVTDSGGSGAPPAGTANTAARRHWPPFQVLNSCPCKCYCRHQPRHRRLPRNVSAWLSTPTNHLSEPSWVATIKLAGSLVVGLEQFDLQATHSN